MKVVLTLPVEAGRAVASTRPLRPFQRIVTGEAAALLLKLRPMKDTFVPGVAAARLSLADARFAQANAVATMASGTPMIPMEASTANLRLVRDKIDVLPLLDPSAPGRNNDD
ncbi:MAG: hypothetical protein Q8K79_09995 [Solirubrobacteraceae bacterium]|nr:hypothetical protein [Solirubrobacteraceae bacterium]